MALIAYVFTQDVGSNKAGDVVQLDADEAKPLVDAGILDEATADDVGGGDADEGGEMPAPEAAALTRAIESSIVKATELAVNKITSNTKTNKLKVPAEAKDHKGGFKNFGDFARCLSFASRGDWGAQRRLDGFRQKAPTGASEGTNADGGYAVIPEWASEIWDKTRSKFNLMERTSKYTVSGQTMNFPTINESSRADGSRFGGLQSYYIGEGNTFTGSKLGMGQISLTLNKLGVFCYLTNELINDNAFNLTTYLQDKVAQELLFKTNDGLINGSGSSQPTGILNAAALVSIAKESGQSAATIVYPNLVKMWGQLYFASRPNAVWLVNQQVWQQLLQMTFPNSSGTYPAFGGLTFDAHQEFPLNIFGRPVIELENCSQLGNQGDIILADMSQYNVIDKPLEVAVSTEYHFNQYETVYRFVYRWDAKSPWASALTPYKGSLTLSPFVVIDNRGT